MAITSLSGIPSPVHSSSVSEMIFLNVKEVLNLKKKRKIFLFICVIVPVLLIFYSFIEPFILVNKRYNLSESKNEKPVKIVFLTDIHVGPFYSVERLEKLVKRVNKLNPDIILLGGDYVHRDKKYIPMTFSVLKKLKGAVFIGGVLGNHDHWESKELSNGIGTVTPPVRFCAFPQICIITI